MATGILAVYVIISGSFKKIENENGKTLKTNVPLSVVLSGFRDLIAFIGAQASNTV